MGDPYFNQLLASLDEQDRYEAAIDSRTEEIIQERVTTIKSMIDRYAEEVADLFTQYDNGRHDEFIALVKTAVSAHNPEELGLRFSRLVNNTVTAVATEGAAEKAQDEVEL